MKEVACDICCVDVPNPAVLFRAFPPYKRACSCLIQRWKDHLEHSTMAACCLFGLQIVKSHRAQAAWNSVHSIDRLVSLAVLQTDSWLFAM